MIDSTDSQERAWEEVMPLARRVAPAALSLLALVLAAQGQALFDPNATSTLGAGLARYGLAALCLLLARHIARAPHAETNRPGPDLSALRALAPRRVATALAGVAVVGFVLVGLARIDPQAGAPSFAPYVGGWLVAIGLAVGAWLPPPATWRESWPRVRAWLRANRWEVAAVAVLVGLAAGWRLTALATTPFTINGDEGSIGLDVQRVLAGELRHPFAVMVGAQSSLVAHVLALPARVWGFSIGSLRLMHAVISLLAVPALYALARIVAGRRVALVATLFLATFPMHLHYSRVAVSATIWDSFFFPATLAALLWAMRRESAGWWGFALAGLFGGLQQFAYAGARLLPLLALFYVVVVALVDGDRVRRRWPGLLVMALVFLVVVSPHWLFSLRHPDEVAVRLTQIGIFHTGWLQQETVIRGEGTLPILWDQFRRALLGFGFFPDRTVTWGPDGSLAPPLWSLGLFFGLAVSLRRWREPRALLLHGWFWGVLLTAGVLTLNPPTSNQLVALTPVLCLFAALGWAAVARTLAPLVPPALARVVSPQALLLAVLALLTALTGLRAHQRYLASGVYGGPNALVATHVGYELAAMPPDTTLVMLGAPRVPSDLSPLRFLTPGYARVDITEPLVAPPVALPEGNLFLVVLPERANEIPLLRQALGTPAPVREVYDPVTNSLLYYAMRIER